MECYKDGIHNYIAAEIDKKDHKDPRLVDLKSAQEKSSVVVEDPLKIDLHVSHSKGLAHGPIIQRRGDSSPFMEDPEEPGTYTTDPDVQRIGSFYIFESTKKSHVREVYSRFVGNYILLGSPRILSPEKAHECTKSTLLTYFTDWIDFPTPPACQLAELSNNIIEFITQLTNYFQLKDPLRAKTFKDLLVGDNGSETLTVHEATESMLELYKDIYPDFIDNFQTHSAQSAFRSAIRDNMQKHLRLLLSSLITSSHQYQAVQRSGGKPLTLMQGCGDLTMNEWNVAFISNNNDWTLLHPLEEPLNDREYSCLIKWKCSKTDPDLQRISSDTRIVYPYQIAKLRFKAPSLQFRATKQATSSPEGLPNGHVFLGKHPIGNLIEFAVYGQQVVSNGKIVNLQSLMREFGDIRHIYKLPNLNRPDQYAQETSDSGIPEYRERPRSLFSQSTRDDVWLGEKALIQGDRNLKVAGLKQAILLDLRELGAPKEWIDIVLQREQETYKTYTHQPDGELTKGQWRWIVEGRRTWLEIFLLENQYPCTMIGIQAEDEGRETEQQYQTGIVDGRKIFFFAHGHKYTQAGCSVSECARYLLDQHSSWNTLMFDEGNDVFQLIDRTNSGEMTATVPLNARKELRCVFWATAKDSPPTETDVGV